MGNVTGREEENGGGDDEDPSARSSEGGFAPYHAGSADSIGGGGGGESPPQSPRRSPSPFMFAPQSLYLLCKDTVIHLNFPIKCRRTNNMEVPKILLRGKSQSC
ncbi:hypothetical protein ACMD2_02565 [Ananas comosus]|uniref:Uncharacterized protein n=1 Tax=Ananas comosus TaxID=4615 RepID=A0A199V7X5_ANACO|nr:hypothetical protein ACMD2_02565 [Ananas comosus]